MVAEQIHRYPRWIRWPIELLCTSAVLIAAVLAGRDLLRYTWVRFHLDTSMFPRVPFLPEIVLALTGGASSPTIFMAQQLLPSLGWLALALLLALLLRNSFPTVRTSARGMLVEFAGDWLPIPWESFKAIKVTEDLGAERFVLLAETDKTRLTGWHRLYSLLYGLSFRPGFLITSAISNFDGLVKTLVTETDRVARVLENVNPARFQEEASSPLFRFLLGPASFLSRRSSNEVAAVADISSRLSNDSIRGTYPRRINALFVWGTAFLAIVTIVRYLLYWLGFAALLSPSLLNLPVFNRLVLNQTSPWWFLIAGHLMVLIMIGILTALRHVLPELEARSEGLAVRYFNRWVVVPWSRITAIKVTEFSEESQVVLVQTDGVLPASARLSSLIYDGSFTPGILITSALNSFEPLLQRVVLEVTRYQSNPIAERADATATGNQVIQPEATKSPIFQDDARSLALMLCFRAGPTIDQLVEESHQDEQAKELDLRRLSRLMGPMFWLALPPVLLAIFDRAIQRGLLPDGRLLIAVVLLFFLSMLEWPLVCLAALTLDEITGGGEDGSRPFYLYPVIQLPRLLPLAGSLILVLLGVPVLPILLWLGAICWSFLLAAGLWEKLYGWHSGLLLAGGLLPVVFQLLILLAYLIALH